MGETSTLAQDRGLGHFAGLIGSEHVLIERDYLVVAPADQQQVAEVLRFASANHLIVTPTGGGTKQRWGNPVRADIHLSLARLNALREHAWQDMTCTVEAGARWADMQGKLQYHEQMVALDPLWPERATIGGVIACNDSGTMRQKFGGLRDLIVGMTVVLADGTIAKTGGKVVKNVAGYDLHKLITGSFGTLAVITEVNFRLHPAERFSRTWSILPEGPSADAAALAGLLRRLTEMQITPTSVQIRAQRGACVLDVRIASTPGCLDEYGARLRELAGANRLAESSDDVWLARERLFRDGESTVLKVSVLRSEICSLCSELQASAQNDVEIVTVAQATGLVTVAIRGGAESTASLIARLRERVAPSGSVVVQQAPDTLMRRIDVWGPISNPLPLMMEIKRRFDPARTLNPGRFVGNI